MANMLKLFLEISLMASVMIGIVLIIRKAFSRKMSPAVVLLLWGMVLLRLMLPFTFASPVNLITILQQTVQSNTNNESMATQPVSPEFLATDNTNVIQADMQAANQSVPQTIPETDGSKTGAETLDSLIKSISIWDILTTIWIIGALITFLLYINKARQFKKRLHFCNPIMDEGILEIVQRRKKETEVKKSVAVLECDFVHAPAVFGYFKPFILIPSQVAKHMDRDSIDAILLHEVLHIQCRDILVNYVWLLAKALHWFNPMVWIAFKRFEDDVELSRDQKVARMLKKDGALVYSKSLLEAARFSKKTSSVPSLATALFENKCKLRARIFRLLKPQRKTKTSVMVSALLAMLMIIACFTTACQPTPSTQAVVGRQQDILSDVTTVPTSDFEQIQTPSHISETDDGYISYNADVVVPETNAYPVTEVTKRILTDNDILTYIKLLTGKNDELYTSWDLSKDDYLQLLTELKQNESSGIVLKSTIDSVQEVYNKASDEEIEHTPVSFSSLPTDSISYVYVKNGDNTVARFSFKRNENSEFSYLRDMNMNIYAASQLTDDQFDSKDDTKEHWAFLQPGEPEISKDYAYNIALQYIKSMNIDLNLYFAEPCSVITNCVQKTTGWQFTFTRTISNLQTQYKLTEAGTSWNKESTPSYGSPWGEEVFRITIDKGGVCGITWKGASKISSTVVGSAQLEDFGTIQQRITNQLNYRYATNDMDIDITRVSLGISLIAVKDKSDIGDYLPTWYVSYTRKYNNTEEACRIMFSAIDGSYIEPRVTNDEIMGNMQVGASGQAGAAGSG